MKTTISKIRFMRYLKIQKSGKYNMFGLDRTIQHNNNYDLAYNHFVILKQEQPLEVEY
jgi:hypothetical protein